MLKISSRFSLSAIKQQVAEIRLVAAISIMVAVGGAGVTVLLAQLTDNPIWKLAKDPAEVQGFPPYIGLLSNWDVILWVAAAAVCLFSAALIHEQQPRASAAVFLTASGILSFGLAVDDLYLLHDRLLPRAFHLPETFFYVLYLVTFAAYVGYFMPHILKHEYLLFFAALGLFLFSRRNLISLPFDRFMTTGDMLKYFGIVFWLAFFCRTALHEANAALLRKE